jgi:hypothetical protein
MKKRCLRAAFFLRTPLWALHVFFDKHGIDQPLALYANGVDAMAGASALRM